MRKNLKPIILSLLMLALSLSVATNSLNSEVETPTFEETVEPFNVILPLADLNVAGHQEGSIFTDTTLSSGGSHTCAILDNGSVSCWGFGFYGQLGNGGTSDKTTPTLTSSLGTGRTAVALSSGSVHTCAILDNGAVSCWGRGNYGQLGNGGNFSTASDKTTPTLTSSLGTGRTAVALSSGSYHTCAILDNGLVSCWGFGGNGQLGNGATSWKYTPTLTSSLGTGRTAVAISSGGYHTCAVLDDGSVSCWGGGSDGQLGNGGISSTSTPTLTSSLGIGRTAVAISVGTRHSCAILDDGLVKCWGDGNNGQLGNGATSDKTTPTITSTLGTSHAAVALSSEGYHTCAILDNGSVSCWGLGSDGQLGNGGNSSSSIPTLISSLGTGRTAVALSSGGTHTCTILDNGTVSCWGENSDGQLGDGTTSIRNTPTQTLALGTSANPQTAALSERDLDNDGTLNMFQVNHSEIQSKITISAGTGHTCAILKDGNVSCWGYGYNGALGNGGFVQQNVPILTNRFGTNITAVAISSGGDHTCVILDNGSVSCWGLNNFGQLGNGGSSGKISTPTLTSSLGINRTAIAISSGESHTCVILDNGSVSCWGYGNYGQIGNGYGSDKFTPTLTSSLGTGRTAIALSSGTYHTCAILDNGSVSCWGYGTYGGLGNGGVSHKYSPTLTSSLGTGRTAVDISCSSLHTCAVLDNGLVTCWGWNTYGQLGDGSTTDRTTPTQTSSLGTGRMAVDISSGASHTCTILDNGSVSCWGRGSVGRLGNGGFSNQLTPTLTSSFGTGRTAVGISAGVSHTCAILNNGYVSCWGDGGYGRLGNGQTIDRSTPTVIAWALGVGHLIVDRGYSDFDRDGFPNKNDDYPYNTIRSKNCDQGEFGRYVCVDAPLGKYVPTFGEMYATVADAGYYVNQTRQSSQTPCASGTYQAATGQSSCDIASAGHYVDTSLGTGQSSQTACPAGTYNPNTGSTSQTDCIDASAGHYVSLTGQSSQTPCSVGTYNPNTGSTSQTDCIDASAGHYVSLTGQPSQTACNIGTYNPNIASTNSSSCIVASPGYYVDASLGTGQASQTACNVGTYNPNTGSTSQTDCIDASAGHYVSLTGQSSQTPCASGTYQAATGQSSCNVASPGHYVDTSLGTGQSSQTACSAGTYNPNTGSTSPAACIDASSGHYVDASFGTGQASQTACNVGTYNPNTGSTSQTDCIDASAGHYVSLTGQSSQTPCASGTYQAETGQLSCDIASRGHYVHLPGQSKQTPCPSGTYNPSTESKSSTACIDASVGHYVDALLGTGQIDQTACPTGTYNPTTGSTSLAACVDASSGHYVDASLGTGQSTQTACLRGTYNPNLGSTNPSACIDASPGHYVDLTSQSNQTVCLTGTYQPMTKQFSCIDASPGFYVEQIGQSSQIACEVGEYQPTTGASGCFLARYGYYVPITGQSNQTICPIGTYQPITGQSSCIDASAGFYVGQIGQSSQDACPTGTYNPKNKSTNISDCIDADTGYYVDQSGQSNQTPCSTGSFNPNTGGSNPNCVLAYRGYYVPTVGQSNQTICDVGTYQSSTGSSICDNAEVGYYVDFAGSSYQIQCDELKSTIDHSSKNETDCLPDLDSDLVPDIIDDDDDGDGINDSEDKFKDDPAEWYDFDLDGIGDNQDIDDDNDGWSDAEELRAGSDPYSNLDQPVEGFEVIVPGTSISLGAWDLIGIFGGLPLFIWVSFGFITRNNRSLRFEEKIRNTKSHSELLTITKQVELCLTLRLLGVNQGIQLDKVRTEVEENLKHVKDEIGQKAEKNVPEISNSSLQLTQTVPSTSESGVIGDDGYEWINFPPNSQTNFYRAPGDKEWILWEN